MGVKALWERRVLPTLIEKACRSSVILEERRRWIPRAEGDVLELGVGSGLNLAFYDPARVRRVVAVDPSAPLLDRARERARAAAVPVEIVAAPAEHLPFDDRSFDTVVTTYTLCSVGSPGEALREARRVLRPGGRVVFVEHGAAPDRGPRRWQERITPVWRQVSGNCHLDRDVRRELVDAGFEVRELDARYGDEGPRWLSFTSAGIAVAP